MASAAPTFPSTRETSNYARLCRLLVDFGSQALRETFDRIHPPEGLETVLATPPAHPKLQYLQVKKILNPFQWDILYRIYYILPSNLQFRPKTLISPC